MIANLSDWTIVSVGQWNPAIFSPTWVAQNLLHVETLETELAVGPAATNVRYRTATLILLPLQERLIVGVRNLEEASLVQAETVSRTALQLLSHTPVRAVGINFGFIENDPSPERLRTFDLHDSGTLSDGGYVVRATEITREIAIESAILKLKMTYSENSVKFHFNYTHQVASAHEAAELLGGRVLTYRDRAMNILSTVFNLQMEEVA